MDVARSPRGAWAQIDELEQLPPTTQPDYERAPLEDPDALPPMVQHGGQAVLHAKHARVRRHVINSLHDDPELRKRARKLCDCCSFPSIRVDQAGKPRPSLGRCRDRMCPLCAEFKGKEAATRVSGLLERAREPRFITMGMKSGELPLGEQIDRIFKAFRDLRRGRAWPARVRAGLYAIEVTYNADTGLWHPHLHIIYDGGFFPQALLSQLWHAVTGDSKIVDIRSVRDVKEAGNYIADYVAKPSKVTTWPRVKVAEFAAAMKGRRLLGTFGEWHGLNLDPDEDPDAESTHVASVAAIDREEKRGNPAGRQAIDLMRRMGGCWSRMAGWDPDRSLSRVSVAELGLFVAAARRCELGLWGQVEIDPPAEPETAPDPPVRPPDTPRLFAEPAWHR